MEVNELTLLALKMLRKIFRRRKQEEFSWLTEKFCQYKDQEGNDVISKALTDYQSGGYMLSKWGTTELSQAVRTYLRNKGLSIYDMLGIIRGKLPMPDYLPASDLYFLSGVFPMTADTAFAFGEQALCDCRLIDILGSYDVMESVVASLTANAVKVNLDAFYAPWLFENPWTKWLNGKNVVVVHPFIESIRYQYEHNRTNLFKNPDVLPEFGSINYIKAVQTLAGEKSAFPDWFAALHYMENELDKLDYEVAIIGCGAYGMSLAAHVKRQGKVAIHLAGWTQMLFGVYGERWVSQQSQYADVINDYWIRPNQSEKIENNKIVENGCYW